MEVFVTGATGFAGLNIVAALLKRQHRVTAYVREDSRTALLEQFGVRIVRGSLDDPPAVEAAMCGAHAVIHAAGNGSGRRRDLAALTAVHVRATQNLVDAAVVNGVSRIVYTSSTATIGSLPDPQHPADEDTPLRGPRARGPQAQTRLLGEQIVRSAIDRGVEAVILNPAEMVGPYDPGSPWGRLVVAAYRDRLPFMPPGGGSFCAATEVGRAHVSALTRGRSGERYILGGENVSFLRFIRMAESVLAKRCRLPRTPYAWPCAKAWLREMLPLPGAGRPAVAFHRMRLYGGFHYFDSSKAVRELGYASPSLRQMLRDCAGWYRRSGCFGTAAQPGMPAGQEARPAWIQER
jgi:dihydroflavonol-4-reductase